MSGSSKVVWDGAQQRQRPEVQATPGVQCSILTNGKPRVVQRGILPTNGFTKLTTTILVRIFVGLSWLAYFSGTLERRNCSFIPTSVPGPLGAKNGAISPSVRRILPSPDPADLRYSSLYIRHAL